MVNIQIRSRPETGALYLDFIFRGPRCREQTALKDIPENRKRVQALAKRIQKEFEHGSFDYATHFPNSPRVQQFAERAAAGSAVQPQAGPAPPAVEALTPTFADGGFN